MKRKFEVNEIVFDDDERVNRKIVEIIKNGVRLNEVEVDNCDDETFFNTTIVDDDFSQDMDMRGKCDLKVFARDMYKYSKTLTYNGYPVCYEHLSTPTNFPFYCPATQENLYTIELD